MAELQEGLAALIERKKRELQEGKDVIAKEEAQVAKIVHDLPIYEAALEAMSTEVEPDVVRAQSVGQNGIPRLPDNPFPPNSFGYFNVTVIREAGTPLHMKQIKARVAEMIGEEPKSSSVENPIYQHPEVFTKVSPGVFDLANAFR